MILQILMFILGVGALWGGTEVVLRRVPRLARAAGVSPLIVTVLLLAVLTSMPEFCVSLFASLRGQASAAIGNIVGSNLVTLTFVTGIRVPVSELLAIILPVGRCRLVSVSVAPASSTSGSFNVYPGGENENENENQ